MATAATELAMGILLGLVDRCAKLNVDVRATELLDLLAELDGIVAGRGRSMTPPNEAKLYE